MEKNTRDSSHDAAKAQEILNRRDADGKPVYDRVSRDPKTGDWLARRHDDHTQTDHLT